MLPNALHLRFVGVNRLGSCSLGPVGDVMLGPHCHRRVIEVWTQHHTLPHGTARIVDCFCFAFVNPMAASCRIISRVAGAASPSPSPSQKSVREFSSASRDPVFLPRLWSQFLFDSPAFDAKSLRFEEWKSASRVCLVISAVDALFSECAGSRQTTSGVGSLTILSYNPPRFFAWRAKNFSRALSLSPALSTFANILKIWDPKTCYEFESTPDDPVHKKTRRLLSEGQKVPRFSPQQFIPKTSQGLWNRYDIFVVSCRWKDERSTTRSAANIIFLASWFL